MVLSHQFWQRRFGGDRGDRWPIAQLDGVSHTVIGVLDPAIEIGDLATVDVWTPLTLDQSGGLARRPPARIIGRLAPRRHGGTGVRRASRHREALQQDHPQTNNGWDAHVIATRQATTGGNAWMILSFSWSS